jgi:hypothetical protein
MNLSKRDIINILYRMRKDEFTTFGDTTVFCTGNNMVVMIDGVEMEYEYYGDATRSIMSKQHEQPVYGYVREL